MRSATRSSTRRTGKLAGRSSASPPVLLAYLQGDGRPASWMARIDKASTAELNRWADRVLTAESLAEVLGTKARRTA